MSIKAFRSISYDPRSWRDILRTRAKVCDECSALVPGPNYEQYAHTRWHDRLERRLIALEPEPDPKDKNSTRFEYDG